MIQSILFLILIKINFDFLYYFFYNSEINIKRKLAVSLVIEIILIVLCFTFVLLYTIPPTYNLIYSFCYSYFDSICEPYNSLFGINVADIVILLVFCIIFNILARI